MVKYGIDFDISADSAVAGRADVDSGAKAAAVAASAAIRHTFIMLEGILAHDGLTFWAAACDYCEFRNCWPPASERPPRLSPRLSPRLAPLMDATGTLVTPLELRDC